MAIILVIGENEIKLDSLDEFDNVLDQLLEYRASFIEESYTYDDGKRIIDAIQVLINEFNGLQLATKVALVYGEGCVLH